MAHVLLLNDIIQVQVICTRNNQVALNTVHFRVSAVATPGTSDADVANHYDSVLGPLYKSFLAVNATYYGTLVQKIAPAPLTVDQLNTNSAGIGTGGNNPVAQEIAGLIHAKTNNAGRAFRGRVYPPWPDSSELTANQTELTTAAIGVLGSIGSDLYGSLNLTAGGGTLTLTPCIFHRKANKAGTTTAGSTTDVTSFSIETLIAVQRRRSARGRTNTPPV